MPKIVYAQVFNGYLKTFTYKDRMHRINKVPEKPGVYVITDWKKIKWVGKTVNLLQRMRGHASLKGDLKRRRIFRYKTFGDKRLGKVALKRILDKIEIPAIKRLCKKECDNVQHNKHRKKKRSRIRV